MVGGSQTKLLDAQPFQFGGTRFDNGAVDLRKVLRMYERPDVGIRAERARIHPDVIRKFAGDQLDDDRKRRGIRFAHLAGRQLDVVAVLRHEEVDQAYQREQAAQAKCWPG